MSKLSIWRGNRVFKRTSQGRYALERKALKVIWETWGISEECREDKDLFLFR
ncbi:hypothetical protein HanIR_Chr15g0764761 [Helianthus annuus]|nr:hypothetical protein HanIR_Chr15g0764761 [Helianthus annuus]